MATTLYKIAEQAQRRIAGGQPNRDTAVKIQELIIAAQQAYAQIVKINLFENRRAGEYDVNGAFIYTFKDVPVFYDSNLELYYADLPSTYIALPHEMGIAHVSSMKSQFKNFVRVNPNFLSQSYGLKISGLLGNKGYWAENNKIYFVNMDKLNANDNVLLKLVVALDNIDPYEDELGVPPEIADQIVQMVFEKYVTMQVNLPEDTINNNKKPVAGGS
jgi:hypothetical protein